MILDIHTHHTPPCSEAVVSCSPDDFCPITNQLYSVGIHPWKVEDGVSDETLVKLETALSAPNVVAVGECGIDLMKGGPLFRQMIIFRQQVELSEKIGKPMIIHSVKAQDIIIGIKKDMNPTQPWLVHGFRGKPTIARMYSDAGIFISFGEYFNIDSLNSLPHELIFAETDESTLPIEEIISRLSSVKGHDLTDSVAANTARFLSLSNPLP